MIVRIAAVFAAFAIATAAAAQKAEVFAVDGAAIRGYDPVAYFTEEPDAWSVVDGKLYLNYDRGVQASWVKDTPGYIRKANANWPKALER